MQVMKRATRTVNRSSQLADGGWNQPPRPADVLLELLADQADERLGGLATQSIDQ
jgi:hypothetical protein